MVTIRDRKLWLPLAEFTALCDLIQARLGSGAGYARLDRGTIWRLRHSLDEGIAQPGVGMNLVESGSGEEFRLALDIGEFAVCPTFRELSGNGFLGDDLLKFLCEHVPELQQT